MVTHQAEKIWLWRQRTGEQANVRPSVQTLGEGEGHTPNNRLTEMQPWFTVYFFGIGHLCYDQLKPVKTRYPLTSITWPYRGLKSTAHQDHVFFKLTADQVLLFRLDRGLMSGQLVGNRAGLFGKPVNAHPGLNVNQIITFSSTQMFFLLFRVNGDYWNSKQKAKQYTENLSAKLQNSNQNSIFFLG